MTQFIGVRRGKFAIVDEEVVASRLAAQASAKSEIDARVAQAEADIPAAQDAFDAAQAALAEDPANPALGEARNQAGTELRRLQNNAAQVYDEEQNFKFFRLGTNANGKPAVGKRVRYRTRQVTVDQVEVVDE